ncbi:MAG TPA: ATP-binding protein [Thermoanaerobaculia bacterium]|nr:ATP-binding protein [Thermoanaerobaculia bacterium]
MDGLVPEASRVAELTRQKELLDDISIGLELARDPVPLIEGPSGSGKSWLLGAVCDRWRTGDRPVIRVAGDAEYSRRVRYPFSSAIARLTSRLDDWRLVKSASAKVAGATLPAGGLATFVVDVIANSRENQQKRATRFLSDEEREILFHLQRLAGDSSLLLAVDNLHFLDTASADFLVALRDPQVVEAYPFLEQMRIVCAGAELLTRAPAVDIVVRNLHPKRLVLPHAPREHVAAILRLMGATVELPDEVVDFCAQVSGGHLEVLRLIAEYIGQDPARPKRLTVDGRTTHSLYFLFEERVRSLGDEGRLILEALELLAVAGATISDPELECLLTEPYAYLAGAAKRAVELNILRRESGRRTFSHEIVQRMFLDRVEARRPEVHEKFARCVARLRSGDYASRAYHYDRAGRTDEALIMRFVDYLQRLRNGDAPLDANIDDFTAEAAPDIAEFIVALSRAWTVFRNGEPRAAHDILENLSDVYPPVLMAEKDYLAARCVKTHGSANARAYMVEILRRWRDETPVEFEQWFRLMSILTIMQVDNGDYAGARVTSRLIAIQLAMRTSFDPFADSARHIIDRRDAALFQAEIAAQRCQRAVHFFTGSDPASPRNPIQLYFALTNLGANLLMIGEFADAQRVAAEAVGMHAAMPSIRFPRLQIPLNNLLVAALYNQSVTAEQAVRSMRVVVETIPDPGDAILIDNNMAVMNALAGDLNMALGILSGVVQRLPRDGYYSYFARTNLTCFEHLINGHARARAQWLDLAASIPTIPEGDRAALEKRHELLTNAFDNVGIGDIRRWWNYLNETIRPQVGPVWKFYGYGFLMSDIQFWSEA